MPRSLAAMSIARYTATVKRRACGATPPLYMKDTYNRMWEC